MKLEIRKIYTSTYPKEWTFEILNIQSTWCGICKQQKVTTLGCKWLSGPKELVEFVQTLDRFRETTLPL